MKKIAIVLVILVLTILKLNEYDGILTREINVYAASKIIGGNLYDSAEMVTASDIDVLDYELNEDNLYIKPYKNEVILPIDGIIVEVGNNYLVLNTNYGKYKISNINKRRYNLYEFYFKNTVLGSSDNVKISGDDYKIIISNLNINYEEI